MAFITLGIHYVKPKHVDVLLAARREQAELHDEAGNDAGCCGESKGEFHSRTLLRWS